LYFSIVKILSTLGVVSLYFAVPNHRILVVVITVSHYLIGLIYSKKQLFNSFHSIKGATGILALTTLGIYCGIGFEEYLIWVFGFHHILTEVYLVHDMRFQKKVGPRYGLFTISRMLLGFSVYFNIVRHNYLLDFVPDNVFEVSLFISGIFFIIALYLNKDYFEKKQIKDIVTFESIGVLFVLASYIYFPHINIHPIHIVMYHAVFWVIYPLKGLAKTGTNQVFKYVGITLVVNLAFMILAVKPMLHDQAGFAFWWSIFVIWGYIHILQSFALSTSNPLPFIRLFGARPKAHNP